MCRRIDENGITKIKGSDIEGANIGLELLDMAQALQRLDQGGAGPANRGVILARVEARALAGGQVDQHVAAGIANPLHDFAK